LKPGETVVTDGQMRVMPGGKVEVKKPEEKGQTATKTPATTSGSTPEKP
jgi:hypothetical protein